MRSLTQQAFPAFGGAQGKHVLNCYRDGEFVSCFIFAATFAAKKFLELVFDEPPKQSSDNIVRQGNIKVKCENLDEVLTYKYKPDEREWRIPSPYPGHAHMLKHGPRVKQPQEIDDGDGSDTPGLPVAEKPAKKDRQPRKEKPSTHVTAQAIAESIKLDPREARQILRKHSKKPDEGWCWPEAEVEAIKKLLTKHRKKK